MPSAARLAQFVVAAGVGLALLAGCSDSPPDDAQPQATATTGVGATPTESAATDPAPSSEPTPEITMPVVEPPDDAPMYADFTEEAAIEFVEYFWETGMYFQATKDPEPWDTASDDECIYCADFSESVLESPDYVHDATVELSDVEVISFESEYGLARVSMHFRESGGLLFNAQGKFLGSHEGESTEFSPTIFLRHAQGRWILAEVA